MEFNFSEKDIIYILNCLSLTLNFMKWHENDTKRCVELYFDYKNYCDDYWNIVTLHRLISIKGNKSIYHINDYEFFKGQEDFMVYKNFDFLKDKERYIKIENSNYNEKERLIKRNKNNFYKKLKNKFYTK